MSKFTMSVFSICSILLASQSASAGRAPRIECTNHGSTISFDEDTLRIVRDVQKNRNEDGDLTISKQSYWHFSVDQVEFEKKKIHQADSEVYGCTRRDVSYWHIQMKLKDGTPLPNAYNRLSKEGQLDDYFICSTRRSWNPKPGKGCFN